MKNILKTCYALVFLGLTTTASAETFKETYIEFQKFKSKTSVGINYTKYYDELANIDYATKAYEKNADSANIDNVLKFKMALRIYKKAGEAWGLYLNAKKNDIPESFSLLSKSYCSDVEYISSGRIDNFDSCLGSMWRNAGKIVDSASEVKNTVKSKK